jgi:hypothetical protein
VNCPAMPVDRLLPQRQTAGMERPSQAMYISIALVCTIAFCLHLWVWLEPACANETRRIIMKAAGGVGCFEFWLFRYQGLLGNVLTAAVAAVTLLWIARQLAAAHDELELNRRQTAATASSSLREAAKDHEAMRDSLWMIGEQFAEVRRHAEAMVELGSTADTSRMRNNSKALFDTLTRAGTSLQLVQSRAAEGPVHNATGPIGRSLAALLLADSELQAFWQAMERLNPSAAQDRVLAAQAAKIYQNMAVEAANAIERNNDGIASCFEQIDVIWKQIRRFEAAATGQGRP